MSSKQGSAHTNEDESKSSGETAQQVVVRKALEDELTGTVSPRTPENKSSPRSPRSPRPRTPSGSIVVDGKKSNKAMSFGGHNSDGTHVKAEVNVSVSMPKVVRSDVRVGRLPAGQQHYEDLQIPVPLELRKDHGPERQQWSGHWSKDDNRHGGALNGGELDADAVDKAGRYTMSGYVPEVFGPEMRKERIGKVDGDCELQHRSVNAEPYSSVDVSDVLLPGEEVIIQLPCLGFSNFPNVSIKEAVGDCHLVMTRLQDGGRRLFMLQNKQERTISAEEDYTNETLAKCCLCCYKKGVESTEKQVLQATRKGYQAMHIFSVDDQLLNMWSEVVTKTSIQRSRDVRERSLTLAACSLACCLSCFCSCCRSSKEPAEPVEMPNYPNPPKAKKGSGWSRFFTSSHDTTPNLEQLVNRMVTQDAKTKDDIATKLDFSQYYGVQFRFANPETSQMHEVIAVVHPEVGQTECARFVSLAMHGLHLTKIQETAKHTVHYNSNHPAQPVQNVSAAKSPAHHADTKDVKWEPHPTLHVHGMDPFDEDAPRDAWHHQNFSGKDGSVVSGQPAAEI